MIFECLGTYGSPDYYMVNPIKSAFVFGFAICGLILVGMNIRHHCVPRYFNFNMYYCIGLDHSFPSVGDHFLKHLLTDLRTAGGQQLRNRAGLGRNV
jgi:hypothetical protein